MENYLLGCDWGTSSFRLVLYNVKEAVPVNEIQSGEGISAIYRSWQTGSRDGDGTSKEKLFRERLLQQVTLLAGKSNLDLQDVPILISGMASSSIGMEDLPYAALPFALDGRQATSRRYKPQPGFPHEMILISGVQSRNDVMRGEETQLIGMWSLLADTGSQPKEAVFVFPGTHSKHAYIKNEQLVSFKSFMTGELYQVTGTHSILKDSVKINSEQVLAEADMQAFAAGVQQSGVSGILNGLFTVRTNQLFSRFTKSQNASYLSGLLIGSELQDLVKKDENPLFLCSGKHLYPLYKQAMEVMGLAGRTTFISVDLVEKAAMTGQKIIYDQYVTNKLLNE